MPVWKWLLVCGVLAIVWFAERTLFGPFLALGAGWLVADHVHRRRHPGPAPTAAAEAARILGGERKGRDGTWLVPMAGGHVRVGQGTLPGQVSGDVTFLTLAVPVGRRVPFCFAVRPAAPPVPWVHMVENTPIPGTTFEYSLRPVPVGADLAAASNHPALLADWLGGETLGVLRALGEAPGPGFQGILFDGRRLASLWTWTASPPSPVLRLAALRTQLLAGDLDQLLAEVMFSQPL